MRQMKKHRQDTKESLGKVIEGVPGPHNHFVYGLLNCRHTNADLFDMGLYHKSMGGEGFSGASNFNGFMPVLQVLHHLRYKQPQ